MELYKTNRNCRPRWASFENPEGAAGKGGVSNNGAKGSASGTVTAGDEIVLMSASGSGIVRRVWMALDKYTDPEVMQNLYIKMYWDGCDTPSVECPLAHFFSLTSGRIVPFESELFSSPEGRSLNCFVPMPFYKSAKIVFYNASNVNVLLFYSVEFTLEPLTDGGAMYFHALWNREAPCRLGEPYVILPETTGCGRYLGASIGVVCDTDSYKDTWFGEGEVKIFLDGDGEHPTLCGTGTEDYIGDGWGQGRFSHRTQGCTVADKERGEYSFYRLHTVDPIYFNEHVKVVIDCIGNGTRDEVRKMQERGVPLDVALCAGVGVYKPGERYIVGDGYEGDSVLFFRQDNYTSVAYFYLDRP